jgi:hypothetical protein
MQALEKSPGSYRWTMVALLFAGGNDHPKNAMRILACQLAQREQYY